MSHAGIEPGRQTRSGSRAAEDATRLLSLAAAPTFAIMALLSGTGDTMPADILCSGAHHGSSLNGMPVMYALMSAFHTAPWLKAVSELHRASSTIFSGVSATRRTRLKPPDRITSESRFSPACAPSASPSSCASDVGTQIIVDAE